MRRELLAEFTEEIQEDLQRAEEAEEEALRQQVEARAQDEVELQEWVPPPRRAPPAPPVVTAPVPHRLSRGRLWLRLTERLWRASLISRRSARSSNADWTPHWTRVGSDLAVVAAAAAMTTTAMCRLMRRSSAIGARGRCDDVAMTELDASGLVAPTRRRRRMPHPNVCRRLCGRTLGRRRLYCAMLPVPRLGAGCRTPHRTTLSNRSSHGCEHHRAATHLRPRPVVRASKEWPSRPLPHSCSARAVDGWRGVQLSQSLSVRRLRPSHGALSQACASSSCALPCGHCGACRCWAPRRPCVEMHDSVAHCNDTTRRMRDDGSL